MTIAGKTSRRQLIHGAVALTAAAAAGAEAVSALAAAPGAEAQALASTLQIERVALIAYRQVLSTNVLSAGAIPQLRLLAEQEDQHVAKLEQLISMLGAAVPAGPAGVAAAQAVLNQHQIHRGLSDLSTQHDCLRLLIDVESLAEAAYFNAIPQLTQPTLIQTAIELMGSDAQHWTVVSGIQHHGDVIQSVPYPFVQGTA